MHPTASAVLYLRSTMHSPLSYHPDQLPYEKQRLRQKLLTQRQQYPADKRLFAAESIAQHFMDHPLLAFDAPVAGYIAMRGELDITLIFDKLRKYQKMTCLPVVDEKDAPLLFREWHKGQPLTQGTLGVKEPAAEAETCNPRIILVPLLAFDPAGYRLGYGGGYYDRTIAALRSADPSNPPLTIGVAYDFQEVDALPIEPHDIRLDGILTETGVSMFL